MFTRNPSDLLDNDNGEAARVTLFDADGIEARTRERAMIIELSQRELKTANNPFEQAPMLCAPAIQSWLAARFNLIGGDLVSTRVSKFAVHAERVVTLVKQSL